MAVKDAYLAGVLALLPEAERGKAETRLTELEEGELRQKDYSTKVAEARAAQERFDKLYGENTTWFEERRADLAELDTLRAKVAELAANPKAADLPKDLVTKKDLDLFTDTLERGAVGFIAQANVLALEHYKAFGEVLDITDLMADKRIQQIGLKGVYADKFAPQLKAKVDAAQTARDAAIREEGAKLERERLASAQHPYPVVGNEPSALDAIEAARTGKQPEVKSVDAMASEYARLSGVRAGVGA